VYLLCPSRSSLYPLKLPESTFLAKGFFLLLVNFQIAMVKMSCQLLFIDFFGLFLPLFEPLCHFSWLGNHLNLFLSFLLDVLVLISFWFGNTFLGMGHFLVSFGKSHFSNFLHIS
jgi:hypothetical protein